MSPAPSRASLRTLLRRFRDDRRGTTAIEFSFIAVPFFALLFAIIETSIVFFAGQVFETGVQDASRQLYTHQLQDKNLSSAQAQADFQTDLCNRINILFNCSPSAPVPVDVRYYAPGATITISDPITGGNFDASSLTFQLPPPCSVNTVVVRGFYQWPLVVTGLGYNIANIGRGSTSSKRLLAASSAFRVEPC